MPSYHSEEQTLAQMPTPGADEVLQSAHLVDVVVAEIEQRGGVISFAQYMNHVLYHPGLGYYSAGSDKFGVSGDFVTAPEISPLFGIALGNQCEQIFVQGCKRRILEFGAGSGKLCAQLIQHITELDSYLILEVSADLRDRQQQILGSGLSPEQFEKITWLDGLPEQFDGIVIGNEVLDAMPVNVVVKHSQWCELGIGFDGSSFSWREFSRESAAVEAMHRIESDLGALDEGYCTEVNLNILPWLQGLSACSEQLVVLLIDYGYEQAQYYHPQRNSGTLMCHYRHRAHADPLVYPGLQDITASVDFDAVADAAIDSGFSLGGLTTQGQFLIANGILETAQRGFHDLDTRQQLKISQQLRTLTLAAEMGERFKVIALQKNLEINFSAFGEEKPGG